MKVRGLSAIITIIVLAILVLVGSRYKKPQKMIVKDEITRSMTHSQKDQKETVTTSNTVLKNTISADLSKHSEKSESHEIEDENLLEQERNFTETEIRDMTPSQFTDFLKITESRLPTIAEIRKLPGAELHHTPELIMQAGKDLGLLKEILKNHESFEKEAMVFYEKCAKTKERPMAIKALCLTNLIQLKKKNREKINLSVYPKEMLDLIKLIIDI